MRLISNESVKYVNHLLAKVNKITRDSLERGYSFQKFKLELLKDKKLEDIVMKESYKPILLGVDETERVCNLFDSSLREDKNMLDCMETGLLFYLEGIVRQLAEAKKVEPSHQIREGKWADFAAKMKKTKFLYYSKTEIPVETEEVYFEVEVDDGAARREEVHKKKIQAEKETLERLASTPVG